MSTLREFFTRQKTVYLQQREIEKLLAEIDRLQAQNSSMRDGMRRCVSCEYRIDYKQRQDRAQGAND